ncbi:MAG TPA: hypothetical protein VF009_00035 [Solirubrobacterales bacterium]
MLDRKAASYVAFIVFVVLLIAGINLIVAVGPSFSPPEKTTTVVEIGRGAGKGKTTKSFEKEGRSKKKPGKRSITVERPTGRPFGKKTTTVEEGSRSFVERVLGKSGLIGLQAAIVVLAAFLGAALTQKALVGDFSLKVANLLEIAAVRDRAEDIEAALTARVTDLENSLAERSERGDAMATATELVAAELVKVGQAVAVIDSKLAEAQSRLDTLEEKEEGPE